MVDYRWYGLQMIQSGAVFVCLFSFYTCTTIIEDISYVARILQNCYCTHVNNNNILNVISEVGSGKTVYDRILAQGKQITQHL